MSEKIPNHTKGEYAAQIDAANAQIKAGQDALAEACKGLAADYGPGPYRMHGKLVKLRKAGDSVRLTVIDDANVTELA